MSSPEFSNPRKRVTRSSVKSSRGRPKTDFIPEFNSELRDSVFSNDVVWRILTSCLNLSDLKACRLVCQKFNMKVVDSPRFKNHVEMQIVTDDLRLRKLGKTNVLWKCFRVEIKPSQSGRDYERRWLESVLAAVVELKLILSPNHMRYKSYRPPPQLWTSPKELKKLSIDAQLLWDDKPFERGSESLSKLVELEITRPCLYRQDEIGYISGREKEMKALPKLASVLTNIRSLKIRTSMADAPEIEFWNPRSLVADMRSLITLVHKNKSHLLELQLDDSPLWAHSWEDEPEAIMSSVFPQLQSLQARIVTKEAHTFAPFLKKQPMLTNLDLTILGNLPIDLCKTVQMRSQRLQKLRIKAFNFKESSVALCGLLKTSNLKEFRLNCVKKGGLTVGGRREVIESLPKDIKSIFVRASAEEPRCDQVDPVIFERFYPSTLTELTLIRCTELITDRIVEFICRNLNQLQLLNLSYARDCTDFGFTGKKLASNTPEFAISDLKGLKSLTLQHCGTITDFTLRHGIKFLELQYLDVSDNSGLTSKGCLEMLKHNPSLEVLKVNVTTSYSMRLNELRETTNPRLKTIETVYSSSPGRDEDDQSDTEMEFDTSSDEDYFEVDEYGYDSDSSDYNVCVCM